jgi:hypothetical protein
MKKIVSLVILLITISYFSYGQKTYTNKKSYDSALKQYCDELESYQNYIKKINFYNNFSYYKSNGYPSSTDGWISYFQPLLNKSGVKFDNYINRLHDNVEPEGVIYINFIESVRSDKLLVSFDDSPRDNAIYSASTYKFKDPGKPPIYSKPEQKEKSTSKKNKIINPITPPNKVQYASTESEKVDTISTIDFYTMPNGEKYTYVELIKNYPSMVNESVFKSNFPNRVQPKIKVISREIVERNRTITEVDVYIGEEKQTVRKVRYYWGGIYFYSLNNKVITESQFNCILQGNVTSYDVF